MYTSGPTPSEIKREITNRLRSFGFAGVVALTWTGKIVRDKEREAIATAFPTATPLTRRSPFLEPATKAKPTARVWLIDKSDKGFATGTAPAEYLLPNITGGPREPKPSEKSMRAMGVIKHNEFIVPARGMKLDRYGNVPQGVMQKIMAGLGAFRDEMQNRPGTMPRQVAAARYGTDGGPKKRRKTYAETYYVGQNSKGTRMIFSAKANGTSKILFIIIQRPPFYKKRYDFRQVADQAFQENWPEQFAKAAQQYGGPNRRNRTRK
jgi:hypothetical protein